MGIQDPKVRALNIHVLCHVILLTCLTLGCKKRQDATRILAAQKSNRVPPTKLYHFGKYKYLQSNHGKSGLDLSDEVWSMIANSIHAPFRRGLYAAEHPGHAERYGLSNIGGKAEAAPWMMEVTIDARCQTAETVAPSLAAMGSFESLKKWFSNNKSRLGSFSAFSNKCLSSGDHRGFYQNFQPFGVGVDETDCAKDLHAFFTSRVGSHERIGVASDQLWPDYGFWYIRDRRCIKKMDASPAMILRVSGNLPGYWSKAPRNIVRKIDTYKTRKMATAQFFILVRALAAIDSSDPQEAVRNAAVKSDIDTWPVGKSITRWLTARAECRKTGRTKRIGEVTQDFLRVAYSREDITPARGGQTFSDYINSFLEEMERACRGESKYDNDTPILKAHKLILAEGKVKEGIRLLEQLVAKDDTHAMNNLANYYCQGKLVHKDTVKCYQLFKRCSDLGYASCTYGLGTMYYIGPEMGMPRRDYARAFSLFKRAADRGHDKATYYMGVMYRHGLSVRRNNHKANEWFEKHRQLEKAPKAKSPMGQFMVEQGRKAYNKGLYKAAADHFLMSASFGSGKGSYLFAKIIEEGRWGYPGRSRPENLDAALASYEQAHAQGISIAAYRIGRLHAKSQQYERAIEWYRKAADAGIGEAMRALGELYEKVFRKGNTARAWYEKAREYGY